MMNAALIMLVPAVPLLLAMASLYRPMPWSLPLAILPALLAAITVPVDSTVYIPWLLLGVHWQLDQVSQLFLMFSALVWLLAALFILASKEVMLRTLRYQVLFLIAMSGNLLLILAADMISFYIGFAMMGLAAYGLLLQGSQRSRHAARVYLVFTLVGELALFSALLLVASSSGSLLMADIDARALPDLAIGLLLLGFGIKLALPGLHPWLPLVYSTAPLISVAILSGPMMKAGLLGWIRFLPAEQSGLADWGWILMMLGILGLIAGTVLSLLQKQPRSILAYSSMAKMGAMSMLFGYAMMHPQLAPALITALILFAMHHLVIKSTLFLGLYQYHSRELQPWLFAGMLLLALSLAGLPFSGGSAVKTTLLAAAPELNNLLLVVSLSGALMMLYFCYRLFAYRRNNVPSGGAMVEQLGLQPAWWLLAVVAVWVPFHPASIGFDIKGLLVIIIAGLLLQAAATFMRNNGLSISVRPGDYYHLLRNLRLRLPVQARSSRVALRFNAITSTSRLQADKHATSSLGLPGLALLIVTALLIGMLLLPNFLS